MELCISLHPIQCNAGILGNKAISWINRQYRISKDNTISSLHYRKIYWRSHPPQLWCKFAPRTYHLWRRWRIITNKYSHIYFQGCVVCAMNFLLKVWKKATWLKEVVKKSRTIVKFIKSWHMPLTVFHKYEDKLSLLISKKNTVFVKTSQFHVKFFLLEELVFFKCTIYFHVDDTHATTVWICCMLLFMCIALYIETSVRKFQTWLINKWHCFF